MMAENAEIKPESLPDLDDLLQCPVCYEIPSGQIFQCNEGHHVCGRCKARLDMCPVCRALFFGTRNYAMEELIANVRKLQAFKLGGKITTGAEPVKESAAPAAAAATEAESNPAEEDDNNSEASSRSSLRAPPACKGLFRCLCCKNGSGERLPAARLLNHLRYYHSPDLIEGQSETGEYVQLWHFSTAPGRIVTAVRVSDMGIFFLIIEISNGSVCAWLSMASSPWVAHMFSYTVTISGNDREAIFSDCVWSVRSCEGSLKKRGHCLMVTGLDATALIAPLAISCKLSLRRTPADQLTHLAQPRAVLRVANRGNSRENGRSVSHELEPFLQDLQNDVARLSRVFITLGREATALARSEQMRNSTRGSQTSGNEPTSDAASVEAASIEANNSNSPERLHLSRNARRRMRQRLRAVLDGTQQPDRTARMANGQVAPPRANSHRVPTYTHNNVIDLGVIEAPALPVPPPAASGPSHNGSHVRTNRNRRQRR